MLIPIFLSCPTALSPEQEACRAVILQELRAVGLEPRTLGRSDYPTDLPLKEVLVLATRCSGGLILGFSQFSATEGTHYPNCAIETPASPPVAFPTPWNQLEAGVLFALRVPLLVFREDGISGGVFDPGVTDNFVQKMPRPDLIDQQRHALSSVILKWQARVRANYYLE